MKKIIIEQQEKKEVELDKSDKEVLVCLAIQKIGMATEYEIKEKLDEWKTPVTQSEISRFVKNLRKKDLVSLNYRDSEEAFSLTKSIFQRDIPIANYKDIVDSKDIKSVKSIIEEKEKKKGVNKGRLPDHCQYYTVEVEWEVKDKILGFMNFHKEDYLEHYREDDKIIFLPSHFRAYLGRNLRKINKSESLKNYIAYDYGRVETNGKGLEKIRFSVLDGQQGKGFRIYEVIPKGSIVKTRFGVPSTTLKPEDFEKFLRDIAEYPIRGFGGRSSVFGRMILTNFDVIKER